jgi:cobalt-zinc-cadmium efflux system protein
MTSVVIAIIIAIGTFSLFRQSLHMLFDGVPPHIDPIAVRKHLEAIPGVTKIHDLHIWAMSTSETALTVHLVMPSGHPGDAFILEINRQIYDLFKISHTTIQVEASEIHHEHWSAHL